MQLALSALLSNLRRQLRDRGGVAGWRNVWENLGASVRGTKGKKKIGDYGSKCVKRERENGVSCLCICEEDMLREQDSRVVQNIHYIRNNIIILHLLCLGEENTRYIYIYYCNKKKKKSGEKNL
jgi:hypothetical protein